MRILISGSSGMVGSTLMAFLQLQGHDVIRLARAATGDGSVFWNPSAAQLESAPLEGFDAVIHLAGENIADGRWTPEKKARIRDSRVQGTRLLVERLNSLKQPPRAFLCASAVGFYGTRGDEVLTETSAKGNGFLPDVCAEWEAAAQQAQGIRVVCLRFGIVLSRSGGALARMAGPFKLGLGGRIGSGAQWWSWIGMDDVIGIVDFALKHDELRGALNVVAPQAATNREFTQALGHVVGRPTPLPVPEFAAHLFIGEMADATLLASARVQPAKLQSAGYQFQHDSLEPALRFALRKRR
ncbi:MAG: TIGR01777 family oxidoreductase [Verrucomicrobiota bacterium]